MYIQNKAPHLTLRYFFICIKCTYMDTFVMNVRSLSNKTDPTADFVIANNLKILFLTETWQKNDMVDTAVFSQACPPDYKFFSIPRHNRRGGVSLLYIMTALKYVYHRVSLSPIALLNSLYFMSHLVLNYYL
jgi:hypothetical protein